MYSQILADLETLSSAPGVAGQRGIADAAMRSLLFLTDEARVDAMGNVLAIKRCAYEDAPTVLLEAHLDEVGFMVTHIDDKGFVHVNAAGGPDERVLASQKVVVYGDRPISGVFCSVPPHLSKEGDSFPGIGERGIDVGLSAEEAKTQIPLGSRVGFAPNFSILGEYTVSGKALDDRAGMAAILHALRLLEGKDLHYHVAVAFCVQEELGTRGAAPAVRSLQPDMAIATDVSFALTPDAKPHQCGKMGKGAMIGIAPILSDAITGSLFSIAKELNISYQTEVMSGRTGTDADAITVTGTGVPTALLSIPLRYMHTPVEMLDVRDVAAVGRLMAEFVAKGVPSHD